MNLRRTLHTMGFATMLLLGGYGFAQAQAVSPDRPGSASGGVTARGGSTGEAGNGKGAGATTNSTTSNNTGALGQTGGAQPSASGHADAARGDTTKETAGTDAAHPDKPVSR